MIKGFSAFLVFHFIDLHQPNKVAVFDFLKFLGEVFIISQVRYKGVFEVVDCTVRAVELV